MTEVTFHFNVPEKTAYACRLLRKAWAARAPVGVLGDAAALRALDEALWTFSSQAFIPHCGVSAPAHMLAATPIVLATDAALFTRSQVLLNLGQPAPEGFERFARLIEIVSAQPQDRAGARQRWSHYKKHGLQPQAHDAAARKD